MAFTRRRRKAVSSIVAGLIVIIIVLAGLTGYAFLAPGASTKTVTQTTTVQGGGGGGSTVTTTVTTTASGQGGGNLTALAQAEGGSVTVYGVIDASDWSSVIGPAFQKQYPWAKVNFVALGGADVGTRALSEYTAGKVSADVLISGLTQLEDAIQGGAVQPWIDPNLVTYGYTVNNSDPTGMWHPGYVLPGVIIYNTNLVSASQAPKSYTDLASSTWKGKVVIQDPSLLGGVGATFSTLYPIMGNASWTQFMHNLAANSPVIVSSNGVAFTDVSSGQYPVGLGQLNDYIAAVQKGNTSVAAVFAQPVVGLPNVVCITKNAPHPYMAELLTDWLDSIPGQLALAQTGRTPENTLVSSTVLAPYVPTNVTIYAADYNNPSFYTNTGTWSTTFHNIFG
ncbi:MAG TPA: extracellular solute-binding protein [Nitrososphaerales archaeon]|nr:extracellular solute-binding protein [Nitrososphaerales archaeon]